MYQRVLPHIITVLFATFFLVPRIVNLHVLDHLTDDKTSVSCELCDILVYSYQLDLITEDNSYLENELQHTPSSYVVLAQYNIPQEKIVSPTCFYNKPPPLS
ncbi:hypothetical protein U6A24_10165 [Aquimarina gracilis]|uniref:Uncharacterized protein n=1 Tax=Aquimarina gracilis TaxID=874422 RepID=A0ABU5ZVF0_9FLAO|nr:hypothetical protein [Aquimarina gracilis]MEB3345828.1 hypothetical protein [Aquimarina gracilis]